MDIPSDITRELAARASFVQERLRGDVLPAENGGESNAAKTLMEHWRTILSGKSGKDMLPKRLRLDGTSVEELTPLLGKVVWNKEKELPEWAVTLTEILKPLPAGRDTYFLPDGVLKEEKQIPFEDVWLPWIDYAHRRIANENPELSELIAPSSVANWLRALLRDLADQLNFALYSNFKHRCGMGSFLPMFTKSVSLAPVGERSQYDKFVKHMLSRGWLEFCREYPVAARLGVTILEQSLRYLRQIVIHLKADLSDISRLFGAGKSLGKVTKLESGLSDPHYNGRTVVRVAFESGLNIIYKPRRFEIDRGWETLLAWVSQRVPDMDFICPKAVEKGTHVWVERLENKSMETPAEAAGFYRRTGALLALVYALGGTDFHQENLLACGNHPVLIDLETLLLPLIRPFNYEELDGKSKTALLDLEHDSVLRTCMPPMWTPVSNEVSRDYGALTPDDNASYSMMDWLDVNTDRMRRGRVDRVTNSSPNSPHFKGEIISVMNHIPDLTSGFDEVYRLLMELRGSLLAEDGPLAPLRKCLFRFLPRNTQVYMMMRKRLRSPSLLRDGVSYSVEVEGMAQSYLSDAPDTRFQDIWKIFELERESLLRGDYPVILAVGDQLAARENERIVLEDYFLMSGFDEAVRRLHHFNLKDLDMQTQLLIASLACRYPKAETDEDEAGMVLVEKCLVAPLLDQNEFITTAGEIAREVRDRVIWRNDQPQWLTRKFDPMTHNLNIGPTDSLLYEGTTGIAVFLAAYHAVTGDESSRELALACLKPLEYIVEDESSALMARFISLGYAGGVCGIAWGVWLVGHYLGDEHLIDLARRLTSFPLMEAIENDKGLDVLAGSAGAVLTFLAFHQIFGENSTLDFAVACGERLLKSRVAFDGRKLWASPFAKQPLMGFAHGAAGYACALLKLFEATGKTKFREAAKDALAYENEQYVAKQHNWPDYRVNRDLKPSEMSFMAGWCSGAPGIGFGRLVTLDVDHSERAMTDIDNAVDFTSALTPMPNFSDHLCCGYAGRIDFLIEVGTRLGRRKPLVEAERQLSFVINRAKIRGRHTFNGDVSGPIFCPGLFTGVAGVGLTCLRMAAPEKIASVLAPLIPGKQK